MPHPYADLPPTAFWRSAVTEARAETMHLLYQPKFRLPANAAIATAGTCFARALIPTLRQTGLTLLDAEPAPEAASPELAERFGYGMYSGRYGHIYTARQMLQLVQEIAGGEPDPAHVWMRDGRYFDALRPLVEPDGLASAAEVLAMRRAHLARLEPMLRGATHLFLTLGLTEAWACRDTGRVFPTAPGAVAGDFDPDRHEFMNFGYAETLYDLHALRDALHGLNPDMKIIINVSPVGLIATGSGRHVLEATTRSKAILRAAVGDFADAHDDLDYFPAYEVVTNPAARGAFWDEASRNISAEGIRAVMSVFLRGHRLGRQVRLRHAAPPAHDVEDDNCDLFLRRPDVT